MTEERFTKQIFFRVDAEMDAMITAAAKRRRTKRNQWMRDALNLALDLENSTPR
jgi:predicted HicB family RNase H-like nuclease